MKATERERILDDGPLVLFDGVCNLCNGTVRFLAARDPAARLTFAAIQSAAGQAVLAHHGLPLTDWDSFVFLEDGQVHLKADALFHVARFLRRPWPLVVVGRILPRAVADWLYDRVARNRYALFGRRDHCAIAPLGRFIE